MRAGSDEAALFFEFRLGEAGDVGDVSIVGRNIRSFPEIRAPTAEGFDQMR